MEDLGNSGQMAGEVALCALRDAAAAPGDQDALGEARVGVLDLDKGELDTSLAEVLNQVGQLAVYGLLAH